MGVREIAPAELRSRLEAGEALQVLDIRESEDHRAWRILGSRNIAVYEALRSNDDEALTARAGELSTERPIVTVCKAGVVSRRAAALLGSLGFDAVSLQGGMLGWGAIWTEAPLDCPGVSFFTQVRRNGKGCLSYMFGDGSTAAVVDPSVETEAYVAAAGRAGLRITHVLETHVHADHLSRGRDLCRATGAELLLPANHRTVFPFSPLGDGDRVVAGGVAVEVVATPGHTGESVCFRVGGRVLLTGDTLFVDSVGRPDLERGDAGAAAGARALHASLALLLDRFVDLPFFPAHHAEPIGFDGVPVTSTLSAARSRLPLLRASEEEFVSAVLAGLGTKPPNHEAIIAVNEGRTGLGRRDPFELEAGPNRCAACRS